MHLLLIKLNGNQNPNLRRINWYCFEKIFFRTGYLQSEL